MRKYITDQGAGTTTEVYRPNHDESGKYYVNTVIHNDAALERNQRIRLESLLPKGIRNTRFGLHENEPVIGAFSIPEAEWGFFQRDYPDLVQGLLSNDHVIRESSMRKMLILHPEWSITEANR